MCPDRAREEVADLVRRGVIAQITEVDSQCYVLATGLEVPSPPWDSVRHDILIAIPATYDAAELNGFYIAIPYKYNGGEHPRIKGAFATVLERQWQQVSWHYRDGKNWRRGLDTLETHIFHCKGFFLNRGAENAC